MELSDLRNSQNISSSIWKFLKENIKKEKKKGINESVMKGHLETEYAS